MKIRNEGQSTAVYAKAQAAKRTDERAESVHGKKDTLKISLRAKEMEKNLAKEAKEIKDVHKIQEIKEQIKSGTYLIDVQKLADKMLKVE